MLEAGAVRFYLDENLPVEIAAQLRARGIDVVTVRDLGLLGDADVNHLQRVYSADDMKNRVEYVD